MMRYFYALLAIIVAVLIVLKPELTNQILAVGLVVAGLITLLPVE